jgi:hypothetical protein
MTGMVLPLPEPPDEHADRIRTQLRIARDSLEVARERLARVTEWLTDPDLAWPDDMTLGVLSKVRDLEVALWAREVVKLEAQSRALGLQP